MPPIQKLPDHRDAVVPKDVIGRGHRQVFDAGLRDQHAIEGIFVLTRKGSRRHGVLERDVEHGAACAVQITWQVERYITSFRQAPEAMLGGDLPG